MDLPRDKTPVTGFNSIGEVRLVDLPEHPDDTGRLVVVEGKQHAPFDVARVFCVVADSASVRGRHAHRECEQFIVCLRGSVEVTCDDGSRKATFRLASAGRGLLVPTMIWAEQSYEADGSVIMVLCSRHYEAGDYIRDYDAFLAARRAPPV
jgi:UDP-2-acetamido-3-amino-2,3-dideoxy-glucuronate N-acetyltransferase